MPDIFDEFLDELKRRQAGGGAGAPEEPGDGTPDEPSGDEAPPPERRTPRRRAARPRAPRWPWLFGGLVLLLVLLSGLAGFWTDVLWYRSVGFVDVLWTRVGATGTLFLVGTVAALSILVLNLAIADRLAPPADPSAAAGLGDFLDRLNRGGGIGRPGPRPIVVGPELPDPVPTARIVILGLSIVASLIAGAALAGDWETILLWLNRVPFGATDNAVVDPAFGRDVGWFLFELPFLRDVQAVFNGLVLGSLLVAGGRYLAGMARAGLRFPMPVRAHLAVLAALYLLSLAFGYQLDKFELVYSTRMPLDSVGVSYTDANAQFLAYDLLTVLSAFAAAFLVGAAFTRWTWPLGVTIVGWVLASLLVGRLYPEAVQRLTVDPNQLAQEQPYLFNNINMTRLAFGLDRWESRSYRGEALLTREAIDAEEATFRNARLWDYRPLSFTIGQLQIIQRYYGFVDVDTDRYVINDDLRQVMLAGRELQPGGNPAATGWVNQRVIYTHGIGMVMVPVNEVTAEGQPVLFVRNLPPVSSPGAPAITEPRIYFGESDLGWVVVGARQAEFDYPRGTDQSGGTGNAAENRWTGTTGIRLGTMFDRLLFGLRFGDLNLLISDQVVDGSQLLMHRSLRERLDLIAPFLRYDKDPYLVVDDTGRLVYVQDAFTTSDRFPNAQWFSPSDLPRTALGPAPFNYIRNSVKVVMDAYDGTMRFYVADPADPIIRAYQAIFPSLFAPMSAMPADLVPHLRYPEELFNVQTRVFERYHVTDPATFYGSNDVWAVPTGEGSEQSLPPEAYYVVMRMPGEPQPEFLLLQPMVLVSRPNMISWVAARNDPETYGDVRVFRFPSDTTVLGPQQIEARIDQDPIISAQITLWNQSGSTVIRGNLIVVPVGEALIYLQPVYLQSSTSKFPEFQRIVVASPTRVVWASTLRDALNLLLQAQGPGPSPTPGGTPSPTPTAAPTAGPTSPPGLPSDVAALIEYANLHFEAAQAALRAGDFARYGEEIELVRQALTRLDELAGASPTP